MGQLSHSNMQGLAGKQFGGGRDVDITACSVHGRCWVSVCAGVLSLDGAGTVAVMRAV